MSRSRSEERGAPSGGWRRRTGIYRPSPAGTPLELVRRSERSRSVQDPRAVGEPGLVRRLLAVAVPASAADPACAAPPRLGAPRRDGESSEGGRPRRGAPGADGAPEAQLYAGAVVEPVAAQRQQRGLGGRVGPAARRCSAGCAGPHPRARVCGAWVSRKPASGPSRRRHAFRRVPGPRGQRQSGSSGEKAPGGEWRVKV